MYFWVRIYDYNCERDISEKGIKLDEFYIKEVDSRDAAKTFIKDKYFGEASINLLFAKPKMKNGVYAILMESNKFFYDRFYLEIDTYCFFCHKKIHGKACEFPKMNLSSNFSEDIDLEDTSKTAYFCSSDCKFQLNNTLRYEGEFQEKEVGNMGETFGYIYLIYNRAENKYYIGQTRYLPFFRWQEHIKDGGKGSITDISFSVITEVKRNKNIDELSNQEYLNNVEAWWIAKYEEEGFDVFNISNPRLTISDYIKKYENMISKEHQLSLVESLFENNRMS
ncbi:GIY-YIG nuclease family protein [uncultured Clostridium sp.]|uniref:GIY-YIG nuclease family protein n=1 Tax=uncultured Clostridium sp. TaxID=59620 RepID=UPI0028E4D021|nr:GIY-YIG nuclease family protein [uncultured Clostridium sp.]